MASVIFNRFFYNIALGLLDWDSDDIRVALVDNTYTPDKDHTDWANGSDPYDSEVAGDNYTAGGIQLTTPAVTQVDASDLAKIDGDDVTWQTSTITAAHAVLFDSTIGTKDLICDFEFTEDKVSANGDFTLQWHTDGIMTLQQS